MNTKAWRWPVGVVAILALTMLGNIWMVFVIADDPSEAIEEHYYDKGVNFDASLALAARSARLGWALTLGTSALSADGVTVTPRLTDRAGAPIAGATLRVVARHVAHASEAIRGRATADAAGTAVIALPMHRTGLWDIEIDAWHAGDHVVETRRVEISAALPRQGP